jgi:putative transposase
MLRATKVRLYPTAEQAHVSTDGLVRCGFAWNKALASKTHRYLTRGQKLKGKRDLKPLLAVAKRSRRYRWLADFDGHSLQQACINLDRACTNFFEGRTRLPRFKRRHGQPSSLRCTGKIGVGAGWITIPTMPGQIRAVVHRVTPGNALDRAGRAVCTSLPPGGLRNTVHATAAAFEGEAPRLSAWASDHTFAGWPAINLPAHR